ncbi:MAG: YraN family protein [Chloroflexi bacterium]|nr:YraN family protein [Chloroflexota bacterium]
MTNQRQTLGKLGEDVAARRLTAQGYVVRQRNWRCATGELDLVLERAEALIFVEVRTRRGDRFGTPEESITPRKRARLISAALTYLSEHAAADRAWRIDVVAIEIGPRGEVVRFNHLENAIEG